MSALPDCALPDCAFPRNARLSMGTRLQRERRLPHPGRLLARKGQIVQAQDVLAIGPARPTHLLLDVAHDLGVETQDFTILQDLIHCQPGMKVRQGDVLAGPLGRLRRVVRAPLDGKVVMVDAGQVLLETDGEQVELKAGLPGEVSELLPDWGCRIDTFGALLDGAWGNGGIGYGRLALLISQQDHEIELQRLDARLPGSILVVGACTRLDTLQIAAERGAQGLICASLSADLLPAAQRLAIPLLVVEGFGEITMNPLAFAWFVALQGQDAALLAEVQQPQVIVPLQGEPAETPPEELLFLQPGQRARVVAAPYHGCAGVITRLEERVSFEGGLTAPAVVLRLEDGGELLVPAGNIEVLW